MFNAAPGVPCLSDSSDTYQEVFLKNGNSGATDGKEERAIKT